MKPLSQETFICLDLETTGLDTDSDRIIEIGIMKFTFEKSIDSFETLIEPQMEIPEESQKIHNISNEMVKDKPVIKKILPKLLKFINGHIIIGHGINFDLTMLKKEAARHQIPAACLDKTVLIDTLRLARLYGQSPINSLQVLRDHFNIEKENAHRAMGDVIVNIEVFKKLTSNFATLTQMLDRLKKPILMKCMPLGKHKGRPFSDIPLDYLYWAIKKDFDQDLLFSIRQEIKKRGKGNNFNQASNPFKVL